MRQTRRALFVAVMVLVAWLPLPYASNRPWSEALFAIMAGLLLCLLGVVTLSHKRHVLPQCVRSRVRPMVFLLLIAQGWVALQWLFGVSTDPGASMTTLVTGLGLTALFILVCAVADSRRRLTTLLVVLVVSGVSQGFIASAQSISGVDWWVFEADSRASGTFINANHAANYLAMCLAAGTGLLLALRDGRPFRWWRLPDWLLGPKALIRLALVVMVIALVMTRSRMGNTAFFTGLLLTGGLFLMLQPGRRLRNMLLLASLLVVDLMIISQYFGLDQLRDRIAETRFRDEVMLVSDAVDDAPREVVVERANVTRDNVAVYALPQLLDRPWMGYGAGAFEASFQRFPGSDVTLHWDHAHNDYLQFLIEYGIVGTLPLVAFVLMTLWHGVRAMANRESLYRNGAATGAVMAVVIMLIHSGADFSLQLPANAATFVVLCAVAVLARSHRGRQRGSPRRGGHSDWGAVDDAASG